MTKTWSDNFNLTKHLRVLKKFRPLMLCCAMMFCTITAATAGVGKLNRLYISTDKEQYFGGDTIWLRILSADATSGRPVKESKYVYVELVNPFGLAVEKVKIMERNGVYSGYLPLDARVAEGSYSIAAYTMFMNNMGVEHFAYRSIKVMSPLRFSYQMKTAITDNGNSIKLDIETSNSSKRHELSVSCGNETLYKYDKFGTTESVRLSKRSLMCDYLLVSIDNYSRFIKWNTGEGKPQVEGEPQPSAQVLTPAISIDKTAYGSREKVSVTVDLPKNIKTNGGLIVSVTDNSQVKPVESTLGEWVGGHAQSAQKMQAQLAGLAECPFPLEIGQEISGRVTINYTRKPVKNVTVAAISPERNFLRVTKTNSNGQFSFNGFDLPEGTPFVLKTDEPKHKLRVDEPEMAICPFQEPREDMMDEEAATDSIAEKERVRIMSDSNLREIVLQEVVVRAKKMTQRDIAKTWASASFESDYIDEHMVTSLEEILRNIVGINIISEPTIFGAVNIATYRGKEISYMIDGVIVNSMVEGGSLEIRDVDAMIDFDGIKYIDFYPPGASIAYGGTRAPNGLLKIVTGRNNGKEDEIPNVQHIMPLGYQRPKAFNAPDYSATASSATDLRSTVYWNPQLATDRHGKATFSFYTTDNPSARYTIRIEGLTTDGKPISYSEVVSADGVVR